MIANLDVKKCLLSSLKFDDKNARKHDKKNLKSIKDSLDKFGQVEPLVVQKSTMKVIGGNGRLEAMKDLGWKDCDIALIDIDNDKDIVFGDELTIDHIVWMGTQPTLKEKSERVGITCTLPSDSLSEYLHKAVQKGQTIHYLRLTEQNIN